MSTKLYAPRYGDRYMNSIVLLRESSGSCLSFWSVFFPGFSLVYFFFSYSQNKKKYLSESTEGCAPMEYEKATNTEPYRNGR